ncbi:MAG: AMP-binding protein, partial [Gammaproteobacteria bacterium]|nr:AMP-binding protein [Gammaproteobacteria bacterium]
MSVEKLIAELRARDITLWIEDGRLRYSAPPGIMTDALRSRLAEQREALHDWIVASKRTRHDSIVQRIASIDRNGELPLSFAQERLWFIDQLEAAGAAYNIAMALTLQGELDVPALKRSFHCLIQRHEILRVHVVTGQRRPLLQFDSWDEFHLPLVAVAGAGEDGAEIDGTIRALVQREIGTPFDLERDRLLRAKLFRISDDEHLLVVVMHHIVSDAWSLGVMFRELGGYYREFTTGQGYQPPPLPIQYVDYAAWQRGERVSARFDRQIAYWRERLSGLTQLQLPSDRARPARPSNRGGSEGLVIDGQLLEQCRKLSQQHHVTPFVLMLAIFKLLLHRYTSVTDIAVGIPIAGRNNPDSEHLIGCFLNTMVLRTELPGSLTFAALLSRIHKVGIEGQANQDVPFEQIIQVLEPDRSLGRNPLFQVLFNYIELGNTVLDLPGLTVSRFNTGVQFTKFDLTCYVYNAPRQLSIAFDYATDLFEARTIRVMLRHFRNLLLAAVANPGAAINSLKMRDEQDHWALASARARIPGGKTNGPVRRSVIGHFVDQVSTSPGSLSIVTPDEALTRGELDRLSDRIAQGLKKRCGSEPGQGRVGLLIERPIRMIAAMLGVMKAGFAFVPLDVAAPTARLSRIVEHVRPCAIVTDDDPADLVGAPVGSTAALCCWADLVEAEYLGSATAVPGLDTPAYLIYTSGSTGQPKGVLQTHRGLMHHARAFVSALELTSRDRLSILSGFSFDTAQQDIFAALLSGAVLYPLNLREVAVASAQHWIDDQALSVVHTTPTVFRHLFTQEFAGRTFASVRAVVLGGEPARSGDHELYRKRFPAHSKLINGLGATECSTILQYHMDHQTPAESGVLPVGVALPGSEILLLDAAGLECDILGEIAVTGVPEGTCYWRDEDATARRFRGAPGSAESVMYLTGDIGRRRADGNILFMGRRDDQVKLRGMRVELSEVEATLVRLQDTAAAAVVLAGDNDDQCLAAYCVMHDTAAPFDADTLRTSLRTLLPEYMIPSRIVALEALPLTVSGKIDRRTLRDRALITQSEAVVAESPQPTSELQHCIAGIWQQVLGVATVGLERNFFDLGGHSLLLVEVRARLQEAIGRNIPMPDLFQFPTVASLARHLDDTLPATPSQVRLARTERGGQEGDSVAIIAMAARLPGAADLDAFWRNLCDGCETIERVSLDKLIAEGVDERLANDPRFVPVHSSVADVEMFDAEFFGYTPREAELMDPQQRLFLECAAEALARAGCDPQRHSGAIGVFAGAGMTNYLFNLLRRPDLIRASGGWQAVIRSDKDYLPMRVSYKLNLRGPSIDVQTACSTSLVAVHEARNSLLRRDCDLALAGGVTLRFPRHAGYLHEEGGILSPDGHCRP